MAPTCCQNVDGIIVDITKSISGHTPQISHIVLLLIMFELYLSCFCISSLFNKLDLPLPHLKKLDEKYINKFL